MVRHFFPQHANTSIGLNSNYPPQNYLDFKGGGGAPPIGDNEIIEETLGVFDHLLYDQGAGEDGFVLIEEA